MLVTDLGTAGGSGRTKFECLALFEDLHEREPVLAHQTTSAKDWWRGYLAAAFARIRSVVLVQRGLWYGSG